MLDEKRLNIVRTGSLADIALNVLGAEVVNQQTILINCIKTKYRARQLNDNDLLSFISSYVALDDLILALRKKVMTANSINKELINDRPDTLPNE